MKDLQIIFKALSDETRLRILYLLKPGEICVCDLVSALEMSQPKISFHLNALKTAGLIKDKKEGKWVHYSINDSDIFRRFLILSILEKTPDETVKKDLLRLKEVMTDKNKNRCCDK